MWWGWGCQHACIPSLSCLPFFLYHPYMPLFLNSHYLLPLIFKIILLRIISLWRGKPPIKLIIEKNTCCHHGNMHVYQVSSPYVLPLASLRSEEGEGYLLLWLSRQRWNTHEENYTMWCQEKKDVELRTAVSGLLALISRAYRNFSLWHHKFIKATRSAALVVLKSPQAFAQATRCMKL